MGHPQFISLYRQEVNIDFLLRFFHRHTLRKRLRCEIAVEFSIYLIYRGCLQSCFRLRPHLRKRMRIVQSPVYLVIHKVSPLMRKHIPLASYHGISQISLYPFSVSCKA